MLRIPPGHVRCASLPHFPYALGEPLAVETHCMGAAPFDPLQIRGSRPPGLSSFSTARLVASVPGSMPVEHSTCRALAMRPSRAASHARLAISGRCTSPPTSSVSSSPCLADRCTGHAVRASASSASQSPVANRYSRPRTCSCSARFSRAILSSRSAGVSFSSGESGRGGRARIIRATRRASFSPLVIPS